MRGVAFIGLVTDDRLGLRGGISTEGFGGASTSVSVSSKKDPSKLGLTASDRITESILGTGGKSFFTSSKLGR